MTTGIEEAHSLPKAAGRPYPVPDQVDLSIVIVTWNSERWIERCLASLEAACDGRDYEIVIHDNASTDGTLAKVGRVDARVLRSPANSGFAGGINRAVRESRGRYIFFLNPDCELGPRAVSRLCDFLDSHPNVAAAAPLLVNESGGSQREFQLRRLASLRALAAEALLLDKLFPKNAVTARYRYRDLDLSKPQRIEQPAAAAMLVRHSVFDEIGPLDEQFTPAWFEDVDYCRRLAEAKKDIYVVPEAVASHVGGASLEHMPYGRFIDLWYRNMWRYARKWFSPAEAESLRWAIIAGMAMRWVAASLGVKNGSSSREEALRAYSTVLRKATHRWDDSSPSS
jgi:GT2 family glycosyltransferase